MAVFVAAGDEAEAGDQKGPFVFGGWVAPALHWTNRFSPAWDRRVLNARPVLEAFHMTQLSSPHWQQENGWTNAQAQARIDEAIQVIKNVRSLDPVLCVLDGGYFRDVFGDTQLIQESGQIGIYQMEPDYVAFLGFAIAALNSVVRNHPDAKQVDFIIERKGKITHHIEADFHSTLRKNLEHLGLPHLGRIVGKFIGGDKTGVPLQAADMLNWHYRKLEGNLAEEIDKRRLKAMTRGRSITQTGLKCDAITEFGKSSKENSLPNPFPPKAKGKIAS